MDKKKAFIVFIVSLLILSAVTLRLVGLDLMMYHGEADNTNFNGYLNSEVGHSMLSKVGEPWMFDYLKETGYIEEMPHHPPLSISLYFVSTQIFGDINFAYRFVTLIFGILTILYIYLLTKFLYDSRAAFYVSIISSLSFWLVLGSLSIDQHSAILMFIFTAATYHLIRFEKERENSDFYLSSFFVCLAVLTSYLSVVLVFTMAVYIFFSESDYKKKFFSLTRYFIFPFVAFLSFVIISYVVNPGIFKRTILGSSNIATLNFNYSLPVYLVIWGTMLVPGIFLLSFVFSDKKTLRKEYLLLLLILFGIAFNLIGRVGVSAPDRYLLPIIPAMLIMSGKIFFETKISFKDMIFFLASFIVGLIIFVRLNIATSYEIHNLVSYIKKVAVLDWNFYFPITGPSGPAFGVSFSTIIIPAILASLLLIVVGIQKYNNKNYVTFMAIFLGLILAQNVYMSLELLSPLMHPNVGETVEKTYNYIIEHELNDGLIYTNYQASWHYLNKSYSSFHFMKYKTPSEIEALIRDNHGTALIVNFPKLSSEDKYWSVIKNNCILNKSFSDNDQELTFVYSC